MTQVFTGGDHAAPPGVLNRAVQIPKQPGGPDTVSPSLSPALMPGKGVRRIRCVGCSHETLPRNDDGAPLCQRCSELLAAAGSGPGAIATLAGPMSFRAPRWLRRRQTLG